MIEEITKIENRLDKRIKTSTEKSNIHLEEIQNNKDLNAKYDFNNLKNPGNLLKYFRFEYNCRII
jgi:hypothetical protein